MSDPARVTQSGYRAEIDGLRAVAVTSVILYHLGIGIFSGGYVGVDIFFVISGYLIGGIIWSELESGAFTFAGFYERRIRRIFPALFVVLAVSSCAALVIMSPGELRDFGQSMAATVLFLSNFYFRVKTGYFNADAEVTPLLHMWSLSVEEQFYIIFPFLLIAVHRFAKARLNAVLTGVFALSLAYCLHRAYGEQAANFFFPHTRAWELALGALIAANRHKHLSFITVGHPAARIIEALGALLVIVPIFRYTAQTPFPGIWAIPPVFGTAMIIFAAHERSPVGRVLAAKPMVGIGLISYSAYLWHQPLFAFTRIATVGALTPMTLGLLVALTFGLAYLSWRFVELPFRNRRTFSRRHIFTLAASASIPLLALGLVMHITHGIPQRYSAQTRVVGATSVASPMTTACHTDGVAYRHPAQACHYFGKIVDWAVLGDSHGLQPGYALAEDLSKTGHGLLHLTFSACEPALLFTSSNPGCSAWMHEAVAYLTSHSEIKNVFLAFRYSRAISGDQLRLYPDIPDAHPNFRLHDSTEAARAVYAQSFSAIVHLLAASGKTVYIMLPIPELPTHVDHYIYGTFPRRPDYSAATGASVAYYEARNRYILNVINTLKTLPNVKLVDPRVAVCDQSQCRSIIDGQALYVDDNHLSLAGARRLVALEHQRGVLP